MRKPRIWAVLRTWWKIMKRISVKFDNVNGNTIENPLFSQFEGKTTDKTRNEHFEK